MGMACDALERKGPRRPPQKQLDRRLEEVATAVGDGYCRLQMPLKLALAVRGTAAGHRLGALEGRGGYLPHLPMHPWPWGRRDAPTLPEPPPTPQPWQCCPWGNSRDVLVHGKGGTRPRCQVVCLWRRLLASLILTLCGSERVLVVSMEGVGCTMAGGGQEGGGGLAQGLGI